MALLPNGTRAFIPNGKLAGYSLDPDHPNGKHKARVFASALGLGLGDADWLADRVREAVRMAEAVPRAPTEHGERYVVDFALATAVGTATVRTAWIVRYGETFPRLTSCCVL